jgi:hypothetical protein
MGDQTRDALPNSPLGRLALGALAGFPVVLALLALAASPGRLLPGLPHYRYQPHPGDAYGYYYCAREVISTVLRDAPFVLAALIVAAGLVLVARRVTRDPAARLLAWIWGAGIVVAVVAERVHFTAAAQFGWPLVWSLPLGVLRVVTSAPPLGVSFAIGLALSLVCNAVSVVASFAIARRAGLGEAVAFAGAALVAFWPLLSLLTGSKAAWNASWQIWLGLSLYTEPLSTALVAVALALVLGRQHEPRRLVLAGALLGYATLVRLSDVLILACVLVAQLVSRERLAAIATAAAAAAFAPAVLLYWPKGYPALKPPVFPKHPFELHYAGAAWGSSYLWHPWVVVALVPLGLLGVVRARGAAATLLWSCVGVTALFYTFYQVTPEHPRFLYVVLPIVLLFWAAGAVVVVESAAKRLARVAAR